MLKLILIPLILIYISSSEASSNDFGVSDTKEEKLSTEEIRNQFKLIGQIFVTDSNGVLLYKGSEERMWKFGKKGNIVSNWYYQSPGIKTIAIRQTWALSESGKLTAHIQQYDSMKLKNKGRDIEEGKLLREEKIEIKDFSPIQWLAHTSPTERIVIRLLPELEDSNRLIEIDSLPMSLSKPVIFDNEGHLWATGRNLEGKYISMKTHLGQFAISFSPFKGAKEIGSATGNEITLQTEKNLKITIRSDSPILATSKSVKIFGFIDRNKKSEHVNSVYSYSSSKEKEFLQNIK